MDGSRTEVLADMPAWLSLLLAVAGGAIAANIYYAQPLTAEISRSLGMSPGAAGLVVTLTQVGYGAGLLLIAPLGDRMENRRLVVVLLWLDVVALLAASVAPNAPMFMAAGLLIGLASVAVQVLVPYAASLAPEARRGRVVGDIMSGLMLGIMLARPAASVITEALSWHAVFAISAAIMAVMALVLAAALPPRRPPPGLRYGTMLVSMLDLVRRERVLRRRAFYQACMFGSFSLFWTTVPLLLAGPFRLTQNGIALFALAGVAGAVSAPLAGRAADRGWTQPGTALAMLAAGLAFALSLVTTGGTPAQLAGLVAAAILLDFGVTANFVLGQRAIFTLAPEARGRLNGLYLAMFFVSGAACSALGAWAYAAGGWRLAAAIGIALACIGLAAFATERRRLPPKPPSP